MTQTPLIETADLLMDISHRLKFGKPIDTPHATFERLAIECRECEAAGQRLLRQLVQVEGANEILAEQLKSNWEQRHDDGIGLQQRWLRSSDHAL